MKLSSTEGAAEWRGDHPTCSNPRVNELSIEQKTPTVKMIILVEENLARKNSPARPVVFLSILSPYLAISV